MRVIERKSDRRYSPIMNLDYTPGMFHQTLINFEDKALKMTSKDVKQGPAHRNLGDQLSREMLGGTNYYVDELKKYMSANESLLAIDQRAARNF